MLDQCPTFVWARDSPRVAEQGAGATGRRAIKGTSGLAAVNGALHAIIGPLALEFAPIRINAVSPGLIATPYWDRMPEDARKAMYERYTAYPSSRQKVV